MTGRVRGWCPGAQRPMMSGDGLVVRVRPRYARLTAHQMLGLCAAAETFGNGTIDLTNRANLQLRGVADVHHEPLLDSLAALDLLDAQPGIETRRNMLVTPFWQPGDVSEALTSALLSRLDDLPPLPAKFGYAIDTGPAPLLGNDPADIRLERLPDGTLILRADGSATGRIVSVDTAIDQLIALAHWFAETRPDDFRRMRKLLATTDLPNAWQEGHPTPPSGQQPDIGETELGPLMGATFGQIDAHQMSDLIQTSGAHAIRVTPWRLFLLEGGKSIAAPGFVTTKDDPLLGVDACPGAPLCPQATVETRALAARLAATATGTLHISGCSKGCATPRAAETVLVGNNGRFDLVKQGVAWDEPTLRGLDPTDLNTMADLT